MFNRIAQIIFGKFLFLFWFFVTSPPALLTAWLFYTHENLVTNWGWLGFLIILGWFLGSWWLEMTTSHYVFDEKKMFLEAVKQTLSDLRFKLAFIPVLGAWFVPDEDKTKNDDDA
jgi:hypothetical protein